MDRLDIVNKVSIVQISGETQAIVDGAVNAVSNFEQVDKNVTEFINITRWSI